jgi:hypothetical protein
VLSGFTIQNGVAGNSLEAGGAGLLSRRGHRPLKATSFRTIRGAMLVAVSEWDLHHR